MVGFMIYHIRSKYTAVGMTTLILITTKISNVCLFTGRKEIVMFFYMYLLTLILEMLLLTGIIPISSPVYQVSKSCHGCMPRWLIMYPNIIVVYGYPTWSDHIVMVVSHVEWFCWLPIRWRWYTNVTLGNVFIKNVLQKGVDMLTWEYIVNPPQFVDHLFDYWIHCYCYVCWTWTFLSSESWCIMGVLYHHQWCLFHHLCHLPNCTCLEIVGWSMAFGWYLVRLFVLHLWTSAHVYLLGGHLW